jgi:hypothetical protein
MNEKPEALQFADDRPSSWNIDDLYQWATDAEELIRSMQARITEMEKDVERYAFVKTISREMLLAWRGMYGFADEAIDTAMKKD